MSRKSKGARERERKENQGMREYTGRVSLVFDPHPLLRKGRHTSAAAVRGSTDLDLIWQVFVAALEGLGYAQDPRLLSGAIASIVNRLSPDLRKVVVNHVVRGSNLYVSSAVEYHCEECKRTDLEDDGKHLEAPGGRSLPVYERDSANYEVPVGDTIQLEEGENLCPGTPKETPTYLVHMGREFESLLKMEDQEKVKAAELGIWVPGMEEQQAP